MTKTNKQVFTVWEEWYNDQELVAIYSNEEDARMHAKAIGGFSEKQEVFEKCQKVKEYEEKIKWWTPYRITVGRISLDITVVEWWWNEFRDLSLSYVWFTAVLDMKWTEDEANALWQKVLDFHRKDALALQYFNDPKKTRDLLVSYLSDASHNRTT